MHSNFRSEKKQSKPSEDFKLASKDYKEAVGNNLHSLFSCGWLNCLILFFAQRRQMLLFPSWLSIIFHFKCRGEIPTLCTVRTPQIVGVWFVPNFAIALPTENTGRTLKIKLILLPALGQILSVQTIDRLFPFSLGCLFLSSEAKVPEHVGWSIRGAHSSPEVFKETFLLYVFPLNGYHL